jgi:hypothetical protein
LRRQRSPAVRPGLSTARSRHTLSRSNAELGARDAPTRSPRTRSSPRPRAVTCGRRAHDRQWEDECAPS